MASLRDLRKRLRAVKNTQKITKAMKMVAASKLRRAQQQVLEARPYAVGMQGGPRARGVSHRRGRPPPDAGPRAQAGRDRGHDLEPRSVRRVQREHHPRGGALHRRAHGRVRRDPPLQHRQEGRRALHAEGLGPHRTPRRRLGRPALRARRRHRRRAVLPLRLGPASTPCTSSTTSSRAPSRKTSCSSSSCRYSPSRAWEEDPAVRISELQPFSGDARAVAGRAQDVEVEFPDAWTLSPDLEIEKQGYEHIFEPSRAGVLDALLPQHLAVQLWRALLESMAAEHGARMSAMDAASTNAKELIEKITLQANRVRQAGITNELMEIVSGAETLNG